MSPPQDGSASRQAERERAAREAAYGQRARAALRGEMGPVLKRWVTGSVSPIAARLKVALEALLRNDPKGYEEALSSPVFGLAALKVDARSPLLAIAAWGLKEGNLDDLVLAALGTAISATATSKTIQPLTRILGAAGEAARETAVGQFITQVQGAGAMMRVRKSGKAGWRQSATVDSIAMLLGGQVKGQLTTLSALGELPLSGRVVVKVITPKGDERQIRLRPPEEGDWRLLEVARQVRGEKDLYATTWVSFALMVVCAAQAESGWFDLAKVPRTRAARLKSRRAPHGLVLSEAARGAIEADLDKWLGMGFTHEPMITEPVDGDYATVKHRRVTGARGPKGMKTRAEDTWPWREVSQTIARTPWRVAPHVLHHLRHNEVVQAIAADEDHEPDDLRRNQLINAYRAVATEERLYFPLFMDFRGRTYLRPNLVTYQGGDLQKSLLSLTPLQSGLSSRSLRALAMHMGSLYGGPHKLDKANLRDRMEWFDQARNNEGLLGAARWNQGSSVELNDMLLQADEPLSLLACLGNLPGSDSQEAIPIHLDGTCNGLQHLAAMFRDDTAAPYVNLCAANQWEDAPRDIYGEVASRVSGKLAQMQDMEWVRRILARVTIDRKLCKGSVMTLPYGAVKGSVEDSMLAGILRQKPDSAVWRYGILTRPGDHPLHFEDWLAGDYKAFEERPLEHHPLLRLDARRLGGVVWETICEMLPRVIQAMEAFRAIARTVGEDSLSWCTSSESDALWVVQAKAKSQSRSVALQGFHLPDSVRGLRLRQGSDEIDGAAHVAGIVANFIHSQDAHHLHRVAADWVGPLGTIHDCFMTRPSLAGSLGSGLRFAFKNQYEADPLSRPVKVGDQEFASWYALGEQCKVTFPEKGSWEPSEVLESGWFFS